ncbi:hypothetical protein L914_10506 [Phytophthora nicotianae]|uniref:Reverse transcriptase domain-containing protein n=1 Tax=Phytophthora nicotianae TaxID=4792 RepID=W2N958_PHYNI|nr:hypothetical protein L914_10506 [Phytophthora nicotianae]
MMDVDPSVEVRLIQWSWIIHDLSFPICDSSNDASDKVSFPNAHYTNVAVIARRIDECWELQPGVRVCIMKGDVKGAFRHLMLLSRSVRWMGGYIPDCHALVIDMSARFGWSGLPTYYRAFGGAISWLVSFESPHSLTRGENVDAEPFSVMSG